MAAFTKIFCSTILSMIMLLAATCLRAQSTKGKLYDPNRPADADIQLAVQNAAAQQKFVLIQAGGNWCGWCIEFARFSKADPEIDSLIRGNFIWYHLNWSKENRNDSLFARYGFPQRFGFPVFIILNGAGERIHTQASDYLEDGQKSYDRKKVVAFLKNWSPAAVDPASYPGQ